MVRFLFGQGWMILWHLAFYGLLLIGVILPMLAFLPLKKPGEAPDTASLGSFGMVILIVSALTMVTFVDLMILGAVARGPWLHKAALVIGTSTAVACAAYGAAYLLAMRQNLPAMMLMAAFAVVLVVANLFVLHIARRTEAVSLQMPLPLLVIMVMLSLPIVIVILLVPIGLILERFQR